MVSAYSGHTCALSADGAATCWGKNQRGQTEVPDEPFTAVTAGHDHSCGLRPRPDGSVTCWGHNWSGELETPAGRFNTTVGRGNFSCGPGKRQHRWGGCVALRL